MKEHFQWGDTDGNNGYYYGDFTPAELQAAWELAPILTYFDGFFTRTVRSVRVLLDYEGNPCLNGIPGKKDAEEIKKAILSRAKEIESSGNIHPPTIDMIRGRIV